MSNPIVLLFTNFGLHFEVRIIKVFKFMFAAGP